MGPLRLHDPHTNGLYLYIPPYSRLSIRHRRRTMATIQGLFELLLDYCIIRCRIHQCAIVPQHITSHLEKCYKHLLPSEQSSIIAATREYDWLARTVDDVQFPPSGSEPVPGFQVLDNGLRCDLLSSDGTACYSICTTLRSIQHHCQHVHNWKNPQTRGKKKKGEERQRSDQP